MSTCPSGSTTCWTAWRATSWCHTHMRRRLLGEVMACARHTSGRLCDVGVEHPSPLVAFAFNRYTRCIPLCLSRIEVLFNELKTIKQRRLIPDPGTEPFDAPSERIHSNTKMFSQIFGAPVKAIQQDEISRRL